METSAKIAIAGLAAALAVASAVAGIYAIDRGSIKTQPTDATADRPAEFLFVQQASSGSIASDGEAYRLTLNGVSNSTILFSDRPDRYTGMMATGSFIDRWSFGQDSFEDDPPNAALTLNGQDGNQKTIIVELLNPAFDEEARILAYDLVTDEAGIEGEFGQATLVIDTGDWVFPVPHGTCYTDGAGIDCQCDPGYIQADEEKAACVEDTFK